MADQHGDWQAAPEKAGQRYAKVAFLEPQPGWEFRMRSEGRGSYTIVMCTRGNAHTGCPCVFRACGERRKASQSFAEVTMRVDTEGWGGATASCPTHGDRKLPWQEAIYCVELLEDAGLISSDRVTQMIRARITRRNGCEEETFERIEKWVEQGECMHPEWGRTL